MQDCTDHYMTIHDTTELPVESTQRLDRRLQDSTSQCRIVQATTGLYRTLQNYTERHSVTLAAEDCMGHIEGSIPQDCTSQSPIVQGLYGPRLDKGKVSWSDNVPFMFSV